jgi:hypothetical protein
MPTRRRGPGRPPLYRHKVKLSVPFEASELRAIRQMAKEGTVSTSAWVRSVVLAALRDRTGRTT